MPVKKSMVFNSKNPIQIAVNQNIDEDIKAVVKEK